MIAPLKQGSSQKHFKFRRSGKVPEIAPADQQLVLIMHKYNWDVKEERPGWQGHLGETQRCRYHLVGASECIRSGADRYRGHSPERNGTQNQDKTAYVGQRVPAKLRTRHIHVLFNNVTPVKIRPNKKR